MDEHAITVGPAPDHDAYLHTDQLVWFEEVNVRPTAEQLLGVPEQLRFAAQIDSAEPGTYPGVYGVRPMTLSIPGRGADVRTVPCAGLTWVGVHPDHRRRGVLSAMMTHHLEQVRDDPGTVLSALHASEPAIYGRYGYGLASSELMVTLGRGTELTAPHLDAAAAALQTRLTGLDEPGMPSRTRAAWQHVAASAVGTIVGDEDFFERICTERPEHLRGKEPLRVLFARRDGRDVGLAAFRREQKWERGRPGGTVHVHALAGDPAARLALLRRLVDLDLIATVKVSGLGADDPVLHWLGGPRGAADVATYDSLWIRLVDLPAALRARGYGAACDAVLDVADTHAPWNAGRWRIRVDETGEMSVERTDREADLRLPIAALGAAYLGGVPLVGLARAGLLLEARPGAAREVSRSFRTDERPEAAQGF